MVAVSLCNSVPAANHDKVVSYDFNSWQAFDQLMHSQLEDFRAELVPRGRRLQW